MFHQLPVAVVCKLHFNLCLRGEWEGPAHAEKQIPRDGIENNDVTKKRAMPQLFRQ